MSDLVAWIKENLRKTHLKEFIMTHTGLAPPAFFAVVAVAAAGTALTVSTVSSLLAPPRKDDIELDNMLDNVMNNSLYSNNQREVEPITTIDEAAKEEEVEVEAPAEEVNAPAEEVEASTEEIETPTEEVEAPEKEETTETTSPTETDGEDNTTSDYVSIDNTSTD